MSVFKYLIIMILGNLPIYILTTTLAFALSTITMNSAVSIAIPILGNMVSELINIFIEKVMLSLAICLIYLAIMIVTTFIVFNKRDIKNV